MSEELLKNSASIKPVITYYSANMVVAHINSMASIGFTSVSIRIKKDILADVDLRLKGLSVYNETSLHSNLAEDEAMITVDWSNRETESD